MDIATQALLILANNIDFSCYEMYQFAAQVRRINKTLRDAKLPVAELEYHMWGNRRMWSMPMNRFVYRVIVGP